VLCSRLIEYGLRKVLEEVGFCSDFVECVRKLTREGKKLEEAVEECGMKIIEKHGLPLDYDVYDECEGMLYETLGIELEELLKEKGD